jgi:hypothetical protein
VEKAHIRSTADRCNKRAEVACWGIGADARPNWGRNRENRARGSRKYRYRRAFSVGGVPPVGAHLTPSYRKATEPVRQQARQNLEDENNALSAKLRQMRGQQ